MGSCMSKKTSRRDLHEPKSEPQLEQKKSHEIGGQPADQEECPGRGSRGNGGSGCGELGSGNGVLVRTSSCTKEEVDAILIECGRLSRSSSNGKATDLSESRSRRKRSYDLDNAGDKEGAVGNRGSRRRERQLRRTPSRERDADQMAQPRSGSRERGSGGGRRVSRSPGRRSASPTNNRHGPDTNSTLLADKANSRPGKMVTVPATVPVLAGDNNTSATAKIQAKRTAGTPPRARSPYRRNPLSEIDTNIISQMTNIAAEDKTEQSKISSSKQESLNCNNQKQQQNAEETKEVARSRSSRLLQDVKLNTEVLKNPNVSPYTALLLEDIQNFHQKNNLPAAIPRVSKACWILEAVADLNSSTGSNLSSTLCGATQPTLITGHMSKIDSKMSSAKTKQNPIVESEVVANNDDLMQPSFHKYVSVSRDSGFREDEEDLESSGSNSLPGDQQWQVSSRWEPNSAESTDRCMSSSSRMVSRQSFQRHAVLELGKGGKRVSTKKRDSEQQSGVGRGRIGTRGPHTLAAAAT